MTVKPKKTTKKKAKKVVKLKRNPEPSKKEVEEWMFDYMDKHQNWNPQMVAYAAIRHFKIKVESPYKNWVIDLANKWRDSEREFRNTSPSKREILNWMIEYIDEHPGYTGDSQSIKKLANKAKDYFNIRVRTINLSDLAYDADEEHYKANLRYS